MEIPPQVLSELAYIVATATRMGVKIEWIDRILGEISTKREYFNLLQQAQNLRKEIEQLDREREKALRRLGEIDVEMVYKDNGIHTILNYRTLVVRRSE